MQAYIKAFEGKSEIRITDDAGETIEIYQVKEIRVEINKADIEPLENQGELLPGYLAEIYTPCGRVQ